MSDDPMLCALPGCMTLIEQPEGGGPRRLYCSAAHRSTARKQRQVARLDPEPEELGADPGPDPEFVPDEPRVFSPVASWVIRPQPLPPRRALRRRVSRANGEPRPTTTPARRRAVASIAITSLLLAGGSGYTVLNSPGNPPAQPEPLVALDPPPDAEQWATRAQVVLTSLDRQLSEVADVEDKWKRDPRSAKTTPPPAVEALTQRKVLLTQQRATVQSQLDALRSLPKVATDVKAAQTQLDQIERAVDDADADASSAAQATTRRRLESQREMRRRQRDQNVAELSDLRDNVETAIATPLPEAADDDTEPVVDTVRRLISHDPSPEPPRADRHGVPDVVTSKRHSTYARSERQDADTAGTPHPSVGRSGDDGDRGRGDTSTGIRADAETPSGGGTTDGRESANDRDHDLAVRTWRDWTAITSSSGGSSRTEQAEDTTVSVHQADDEGRQDGDRHEASRDAGDDGIHVDPDDSAASSRAGSSDEDGSEGYRDSGDRVGGRGSSRDDDRFSRDDIRPSDDDVLPRDGDASSRNRDGSSRAGDGNPQDRDRPSDGARDGSSQGGGTGSDRAPWSGDPDDPRPPAAGRPSPHPRDPGRPGSRWGAPPWTGPVEPGYPPPVAGPGTDSPSVGSGTSGRDAGDAPSGGSDDADRPGKPHHGPATTPADGAVPPSHGPAAGDGNRSRGGRDPVREVGGSATGDQQAASTYPAGGEGPDRHPKAAAGRHAAPDTADDAGSPATPAGTNAPGRHAASDDRAVPSHAEKPGTEKPRPGTSGPDKPGTDQAPAPGRHGSAVAASRGGADTDHPVKGAPTKGDPDKEHAATSATAKGDQTKGDTGKSTEHAAKAGPAKTDSKSRSAKADPGKSHASKSDTDKSTEHAAKAGPAKTDSKSRSAKAESSKGHAGNGHASKSDTGKSTEHVAKTSSAKSHSSKSHSSTSDSSTSDSSKSHPSKSDSHKSDSHKSDSHKSDSHKSDSGKSHSKSHSDSKS